MKDRRGVWIMAAILVFGGVSATSCYGRQAREKGAYAIIMKSRDNWYNELAGQGYRQVIEDAGKNCITLYPEEATAQEQIRLIRNLMTEHVDTIAVAANDEHALAPVLKEAMAKGIFVITLDADTAPDSRSIYIKPVDAQELGRELVREALSLCGGEGQWAILSAGSRSANQNEWIQWMKTELEEPAYKDMRLVDIAFGEGMYDKAADEARRLLKAYPGLKVICSLSTEGIKAAADVIKEQGKAGKVKVTGLGLPGQMDEYIGGGEGGICPAIYIWDPVDMGAVAAGVSMGLYGGPDGLEAGRDILLDGRAYRVGLGRAGGLEIISGEPIRIDQDNIGYWKKQFSDAP